jgi:superfamily II DNA/RNA helicase
VATDVAARGIDVPTITHVFNFGLPMKAEDYTHRIGRTGRAGRTGIAVTLVDWDELHKWKIIDDALHLGMPEPAETYSSSDHLRSDLSIPESATGRIAPPAPKEREGTSDGGRREQRAPRANRERRRTRGARSGSSGDVTSAEKATSDPASADSSQASSEASGETGEGSSRPRRRRRRGRGRGASGEGTAQAAASNATASSDQ